MTEVIKASSDADLLGMIPTLAGYTARNSVVCAAFSGTRTGAAFRIDLPKRRRESDYCATSAWILDALRRIPGTDGAVIVIYTDETFATEHGVPRLDFSRHLTHRLQREGFGVVGAFCVAADGWANYYDRDYPREGRSLAEIVSDPSVIDLRDLTELPTVTAAERFAFLEDLTDLCTGYWPRVLEHINPNDTLALIELCAEWEETAVPDSVAACLLEMVQSASIRDEAALQFAFGTVVAEAVMENNRAYLEAQRRDGGTMDEVVQREIAAGRACLDDEFMGLMMGQGRLRPDPARIERALTLLRRIVALAPEHYLPNPLCMLAWLLWARGLGSASAVFIERALAIDPDHGMANVLLAMTANGRLPEWTYG